MDTREEKYFQNSYPYFYLNVFGNSMHNSLHFDLKNSALLEMQRTEIIQTHGSKEVTCLLKVTFL